VIPAASENSRATGPAHPHLRWIVPAALLAIEFLTVSLLVDLPTTGVVVPVVSAIRVVVPVVLGAAVAGWLVARSGGLPPASPAEALPPWRPGAAVVAQLATFGATTALALRLLGAGAPSARVPGILALLGLGATLVVLAAAVAAPLPWLARQVLHRWRAPLLALALGVAVWRAASAAEHLWGTLAGFTLRAVAALLRAGGGDVTIDVSQALIGMRDFAVTMAPECSGVDGIGLVLVFGLTWLALARDRIRTGRALWLVLAAAVVAYAANIARITGLVLLGAAGKEALAVGGFHSKVGWAFFIALALGFVAVAEHLPWLRRTPAALEPRGPSAPSADPALVAPLVAALATALLTGIWTAGPLDRAYGLRILAALAVLLAVRGALPSLRPTPAIGPAAIGLLVGVLWLAAVRGDPGPLGEELARVGAWGRAGWLLIRVLGSVLVIPVIEELAFRGFLFDFLAHPRAGQARPSTPWVAVGASALAFGALHASFLSGVLAGLAYGALRAWRGRVGDAVIAHAASNLVVAAAALAFGRWDLWT
jgi:exosortase E/protease (VPEID-CTERM system)